MGKVRDYTHQRFGKFVALKRTRKRFVEGKPKGWFWEFQCDCGNIKELAPAQVAYGKVQSCGCSKRKLPKGEGGFRNLLRSYKSKAKDRGYSWKISDDYFKQITQQNCYYCNSPPVTRYGEHSEFTKYIYNGIDRKNNTLGYTVDNCLACCGTCNRMKMTDSFEDFCLRIVAIYNNLRNK